MSEIKPIEMNEEELEILLQNTLVSEGYWQVNKTLTKYFDCLVTAVYLAELLSKEKYFKEKGLLQPDGSFYTTQEKIQDSLCISPFKQAKILKRLEDEEEIVSTYMKGIPRKQYKRINKLPILKILKGNSLNFFRNEGKENRELYISNNIYNKNKSTNISKIYTKQGLRMDGRDSPISENGIFHSNLTKRIVTRYNKEKNILCRVNTNKRTKVIESIEKNIRLLKEGKFQTKNRIDDKFRKLNSIPFEDKKYSITEIEKAFDNLILMFDSSYHPVHKPKGSLSSLIYNPVTKTSWLLEAIYNPPKPLKRQREFVPDFPEISDLFKKEFNISNDVRLNAGINSIDVFQKQIPEFALKQNVINREFGSLQAICKTYINWLKHQDWLEEVGVGLITAEGKMWKRFIEEYEKEVYFGFNLRSKK